MLGIVNVPSSAIKVSDLIIVEKVCAVSPQNWGLETKGILNQVSLNTGLLEGFYLQLILSPLTWKCIHRVNVLNCSFLLCKLEVRMATRCLSSSFLIQTQRLKANMQPSVFTNWSMKYLSNVWWKIEKIALAEINMVLGKIIISCNSTLLALITGQSQYKI